MNKFLNFLAILCVTVLFVAGCDKLKGGEPDSPVVAKVGDAVITEEDFLQEITRVPEWAQQQFNTEEGRKQFLDELVKKELIYQNARDLKLHKDKEYIDKVEEFKKMTLVQLILKKEIEEKAGVTEEEVRAYFDQNPNEIRASHILVKTEEEANDVIEKINSGESFAELAKSVSIDSGSAKKGGDLGYFSRGSMLPAFENVAFGLESGEISEPVQTRYGYHIIKVTDIREKDEADYQKSRESIGKRIVLEKRKALFDSYVNKLKGDTEITTYEDALMNINLPWEQSGQPAPETSQAPEEAPAE